jgi:hypothetical protein
MMITGAENMSTNRMLGLFGHGSCGTTFFAELNDERANRYKGTCPNPSCNRPVALFPREFFSSLDKARREYIRKAKSEEESIFWQAS